MEFIIDKEYDDVRLDRYMRKHFPDIPLTEIFKMIRVGKIKVNGKKSKENYRLKIGDILKIFTKIDEINKKNDIIIDINREKLMKLNKYIVYEDENILIFNKEANMVMHKGSGHEYGISEMLKAYLNNSNFNFINRIDKATSGLIIGAKNLVTIRELSEEMRERDIEKKYYILVDGVIAKDKFIVVNYLKKIEDRVIEVDSKTEGAKRSETIFKVVKRGKNRTLLEGKLESGRTHQLRVQLAQLGHSIIGDNKYGKIKSKQMFLFSYYVNIKRYNIRIELPIPNIFLDNL